MFTAQKVDVNQEVLDNLPKYAKTKDIHFRQVQVGIAEATIPTLKVAIKLMKQAPVVRQDLWKSVILLGHTNALLNQVRREALKHNIQSRFHSLCKPVLTLILQRGCLVKI